MPSSKIEAVDPQHREESEGSIERSAQVPAYRTPELRQIGKLELMQGRNFYRDKDCTNDNRYI